MNMRNGDKIASSSRLGLALATLDEAQQVRGLIRLL